MTKADAIRTIVQCAEAYRDNLENTNLLIAHTCRNKQGINCYEAVFLPRHFLHLTGAKFQEQRQFDSVQFYNKCLDHRLSEYDFEMAADGTTTQKLTVLPLLMKKNLSAKMIGDYRDTAITLRTEKVAGSISACLGFVFEKEVGYYVPNTVLKKDIREATRNDYARIVSIFQKNTCESKYSNPVYAPKDIDPYVVLAAISSS